MKYILASFFLLSACGLHAQTTWAGDSNQPVNTKCGTWMPDTVLIYNEWFALDTLNKPVKTTERKWVESEPFYSKINFSNAVYCPCGCGDPTIKYQLRICSITGIRQERSIIQRYHLLPPPETKYDKAINKFKKP